jgi:hypothetical protein
MKLKYLSIIPMLFLANRAYALLPYSIGVRAEGMGTAVAAISLDASALYWNPACLSEIEGREVTGSYSKDYFDTSFLFLSYGQAVSSFGGAAMAWSRVSNSFEKTDILENSLGAADVENDTIFLGAAYNNELPFSIGASARMVREVIGSYAVTGASFNGGFYYRLAPLNFALVAQDFGSTGLEGNGAIRLGLAYSDESKLSLGSTELFDLDLKYSAALDVLLPSDYPKRLEFNPGVETWFNNTIGIRSGIKDMRDFSIGLSFKSNMLQFDYAFLFSQDLENRQLFSTSYRF